MCYFSKYAMAIYGKLLVNVLLKKKITDIFKTISEAEVICSHLNIPLSDIVYSHLMSARDVPVHALCLDHQHEAIVLAIRGTLSAFDAFIDMQAEYTDHTLYDYKTGEAIVTGKVHTGIAAGAWNIQNNIRSRVLK
jgi:hypothetical protein